MPISGILKIKNTEPIITPAIFSPNLIFFEINTSLTIAKIIGIANHGKNIHRCSAGRIFDVTFSTMNTRVTIDAPPNFPIDFADDQKIRTLKNGIVLAAIITATYGSGSKSIVSPVDIGNVNWKINPITINHNTPNAKINDGFVTLKLWGTNLANPITIPVD